MSAAAAFLLVMLAFCLVGLLACLPLVGHCLRVRYRAWRIRTFKRWLRESVGVIRKPPIPDDRHWQDKL